MADVTKRDQYELIKTRFKNAHFPSLERLTVKYGENKLGLFRAEVGERGPPMGLFSECVLPKLRVAAFSNCIHSRSVMPILSSSTWFSTHSLCAKIISLAGTSGRSSPSLRRQ